MSRKAIGPRDNGKVPRDSVFVPGESPRHRVLSRTILQVPVLRLKSLKFSIRLLCILQTQNDNITITNKRLNRHEEDMELWLRVRLKN